MLGREFCVWLAIVKGDGIGDNEAHFLEEELFAGGHGVRMAKQVLALGLGREPAFASTR